MDKLKNLTIMVTRPSAQSVLLCEQLTEQGAEIILCPVLKIEPVNISSNISPNIDILIFTSANAVHHGHHLYQKITPNKPIIAAIGPATKRVLVEYGLETDIIPEADYSSEGLLGLSAFSQKAILHKQVLLISGHGGRELLQSTLRQRGAIVQKIPVYERKPANTSVEHHKIDIITVHSTESLVSLFQLFERQNLENLFFSTPLLVINQKMVKKARDLGCQQSIIVAESATDDSIMKALINWADNQRG